MKVGRVCVHSIVNDGVRTEGLICCCETYVLLSHKYLSTSFFEEVFEHYLNAQIIKFVFGGIKINNILIYSNI